MTEDELIEQLARRLFEACLPITNDFAWELQNDIDRRTWMLSARECLRQIDFNRVMIAMATDDAGRILRDCPIGLAPPEWTP